MTFGWISLNVDYYKQSIFCLRISFCIWMEVLLFGCYFLKSARIGNTPIISALIYEPCIVHMIRMLSKSEMKHLLDVWISMIVKDFLDCMPRKRTSIGRSYNANTKWHLAWDITKNDLPNKLPLVNNWPSYTKSNQHLLCFSFI